MDSALALIAAHGPLILFLIILGDQAGLPVPMEAFLLGAGALVAEGRMPLAPAAASLLAAGFLGNLAWYALGRRFGNRLLGFACRLSLEPDSCVKRTENLFTRHGVKSLLVSKFVPGIDVLGPPLAGAFGTPFPRFALFDLAGLAIWMGVYLGAGAIFHAQLGAAGAWIGRLGSGAAWLGGGALALYVAYKFLHRRYVARKLRVARVTPEELKRLMDAGSVAIVDLRHRLAARERPVSIPGALHLSPEDVAARHAEIPRDRDIVLFCA